MTVEKRVENKSSLGVVTKRQGGGTLIESRPIFTEDANYIYVNCGWGMKAFSVKTGECIKVYNAFASKESVVAIFLYESQPTAVTSDGFFISWEGKSGKVLLKYKIKLPENQIVSNAFLLPSLNNAPNFDLCVTVRQDSNYQIALQFYNPADGKRVQHPLKNIVVSNLNLKHNLSFGGPEDKPFLASISSNGLNVYALNKKKSMLNVLSGGGRLWTCVRCHPTEEIVAAGDNTGRVVVYHKILGDHSNHTPKAIYHWHTLPCQDIAFSPAGSSMFSGGGENVLVKWNLDNPHVRHFLPRLSADIVHINVSPDNQLVALATIDNAIQVVEPPIRLKCVLQQLAWGVLPTSSTPLFPAGLSYEPRTRALALNGRTGHLQFYSPSSETLLFSLDVTLQNYLTQERNKVIINTEVTHAAITCDGAWLATVETREDPGVTTELRLKLWQYVNQKKSFSLNTSIEHPHDGKVHSLIFQPCSNKLSTDAEINFDYVLATTGTDKKFRLWVPRDLDSIYRKGVTWACDSTCHYRGLNCGPASFSEDGSLIAVGFGPSLTVWDVDSINLKESLTNGTDDIKLVAFGMKECCHLLVCATENMLLVWNLLTVRLSWKVSVQTSILVADPCSTYMAAFTTDNRLFVFSPLSTEPVYESEKVCDRTGHVLSAVFVPREISFLEGPHWLQNSLLYYIDSNQELICFESEEESGEVSMLKLAHDNDPGTLFSALIAAQQASNVQKSKPDEKTQHFGVLGAAAVTQLLQAPAHTMPPVSLICSSLLQSLVLTKKSYEEKRKENKNQSDEEENMEEDAEKSSSSSESESDDKEDKISDKKSSGKIISLSDSDNEELMELDTKQNEDKSDEKPLYETIADIGDLFVIDDN